MINEQQLREEWEKEVLKLSFGLPEMMFRDSIATWWIDKITSLIPEEKCEVIDFTKKTDEFTFPPESTEKCICGGGGKYDVHTEMCNKFSTSTPPLDSLDEEFDKFMKYATDTATIMGRLGDHNLTMKKIKSFLHSVHDRAVRETVEKLEGMKRKRKPTHGTCCTCQTCGYSNESYDECECSRNEIIDEIIVSLTNLKGEN